ncbi:nonstructural protein [Sigmofec virus UA08Rod_5935]|uniref:Nonstructural protein n=1 Tax=Sigmofec virus UA08Rod_5935 TaxID=2929446 RepID=A0A976N0S9_9VIRU|nr:nonstructural protein [Sigmofec virus UA08Rod_5935]
MKYPVFSIRDFKSGFLTPVCEANAAVAARNFQHACMASDSLFFSHPEDYALYHLGYFDTDTGVMTPLDLVDEIITATQAIQAMTAHSAPQEVTFNGK